MKKLKKGDRVMYYGCFNEYLEVSKATVTQLDGDRIFIETDKGFDCDSGRMSSEFATHQWAHRKQLRKLV